MAIFPVLERVLKSRPRLHRVSNWIAILFIATLGKVVFNMAIDNGINWDYAQHSESYSKWNGVFICKVEAEPSSFIWHGTPVTFREIWIEREVHTDHPLIWFWCRTPSGRDLLCFTLRDGDQLFQGSEGPYFITDSGVYGDDSSVGMFQSRKFVSFDDALKPDALDSHRAQLYLVKDLNAPHGQRIELRW
jgi:hypothetical protein